MAQDELAALSAEIARVTEELERVVGELEALEARAADRRAIRDRLARDAFRLAALPYTPSLASLTDAQREAFAELVAFDTTLRETQARLAERAATLADAQRSATAKQTQLRRLRDRAHVIAQAAADGDAARREAELLVLQSLGRDAAAAQTALAQIVATAIMPAGESPSSWSMPLRGVITQGFGPTTFGLEPPRAHGGTYHPHFHDAIDIAAPLGTPVRAAAEGRVTFVGHLTDGAMVVVVAHAGRIVSVYAHLDDTFARPPVRIGDAVHRGQIVGFVGLTGITTGPHLHFSTLRAGEPIDPLTLLAGG